MRFAKGKDFGPGAIGKDWFRQHQEVRFRGGGCPLSFRTIACAKRRDTQPLEQRYEVVPGLFSVVHQQDAEHLRHALTPFQA